MVGDAYPTATSKNSSFQWWAMPTLPLELLTIRGEFQMQNATVIFEQK